MKAKALEFLKNRPVKLCAFATVSKEGEEYTTSEEFFFTQNPHAVKFKNPDTIFIKATPVLMRATDFDVNPPKAEEVQL